VRQSLVAALALRVACSLIAAAVPLLLPGIYPWRSTYLPSQLRHVAFGGQAPPLHYGPIDYLLLPWYRWDTIWYVEIAQHGYSNFGTSAFMPLYPLLTRLASPLTGGDALAAALFVATVTTVAAFLGLFRLIERYAPGSGSYALLVAALLPTAFFFVAGYTESLFLALTLWTIISVQTQQWGWAACLGALAALTRQQGVLLAVLGLPALWEWAGWLRGGRTAPRPDWRPVIAALMPAFAYGIWLGILVSVLHAPPPWTPLTAVGGWNLRLTWPGAGLIADAAALIRTPPTSLFAALQSPLLDLVAALAALVALLGARRRFPVEVQLLLAAVWLTSLVKVFPSGLTVSEGRYMLQMLPLCTVPAGWLRRSAGWVRLLWVASASIGLILYLWLFVLSGWVA
jgi:hypothetical protein